MPIYFEPMRYCIGKITNDIDDDSRLIQTDWDAPGVAGAFGWSLSDVQTRAVDGGESEPCDHRSTDGTVDCGECGVTAGAFISSACEYLSDDHGPAEDPGYFESE